LKVACLKMEMTPCAKVSRPIIAGFVRAKLLAADFSLKVQYIYKLFIYYPLP